MTSMALSASPSACEIADLADRCGRETLAQVDASVEQLGRATRLLEQSLAQIRESFVRALAVPAAGRGDGDDPQQERVRHLEAAMVALQCEDTVGQMLGSLRTRQERLARALRHGAAPLVAMSRLACEALPDATSAHALTEHLRGFSLALADTRTVPQPVSQLVVESGEIELF